ncbi:hypothetical protein PINS_up022998 [Pythium insidiosum]|nr:hypothetical protein PINS_up022998 [Pythium insidiosum]
MASPRRRSIWIWLTIVAALIASATAAENNTAPAPAPAPVGPNPSPVPNTYAVPAPSAVPGSKTFAYVKNVQCTDEVAKTSFSIYSKKPRAL